MITRIYRDEELNSEISVEEMNKKEGIEYATEFVNGIKNANYSTEMSVYVEYKDGSTYINIDGEEDGKFKKRNIKSIILDDGYEYYIYGAYIMTENLIPEVA